MTRKPYILLVSLCLALWASALSAQTHYSFDYRLFQNDMTVYFRLKEQPNTDVATPSNYEVAAFVDDECRGIGTIETQTGTGGKQFTYGYLRIYSNMTNGENITIKCWNKVELKEEEVNVQDISFVDQSVIGLPSSPIDVKLGPVPPYILGDVNDDGSINTVDLALLINKILEIDDPRFNVMAGDLNGDGQFNTVDMALLINLILTQ